MKFVEDASLGLLSALLSSQNGAIRCSARLERYAARLTGRSKAAAKKMEAKILRDLEQEPSSPELTSSALGDMHNASSRRLLISLISALNATAPELSFENLQPSSFAKVELLACAQAVNSLLQRDSAFLTSLWSTIDSAAALKECNIFKFTGDPVEDETEVPSLWAFTYFFVNHRRREVVFFTCSGFPSGVASDTGDAEAIPAQSGPANSLGSQHTAKRSRLFDLLQSSQDYEDGTWDMEGDEDEDEV